jgi:hypothetical protein
VLDGPAPHAGPVGFEVAAPVQFADDRTVGTGRFGTEQILEQFCCGRRPRRTMIAPREPRHPILSPSLSAGA